MTSLLTSLMLSDNGLKNLKINFATLRDFNMSSLVLHNTFNKDKVQNYEISVARLTFDGRINFMGTEVVNEFDPGNWYTDAWTLEECDQKYKNKDLVTYLIYKNKHESTMRIECEELFFKLKDYKFKKNNQ